MSLTTTQRKSKSKRDQSHDECTVADLVRQTASDALRGIREQESGVLALEAEPIHDMRVSTRRLRAILTVYAALLDGQWATELADELRWLAHQLGEVRDLDVLTDRLKKSVEPEDRPRLRPLFAALQERHRLAQRALKESLLGERYKALLAALSIAADSVQGTLDLQGLAQHILPPLLEKSWMALKSSSSKLRPKSDSKHYHSLRKDAKRLRYATEALESILRTTERAVAKQFIKRLKKIQDVLGELQDSVVTKTTIELLLNSDHYSKAFQQLSKQLISDQKEVGKAARDKFAKAWTKLDRKKNTKWLRHVVT